MASEESQLLLQKAIELEDTNEDEAIALYLEILEKEKRWSVPYYNLGLIYKYRREWELAYQYNAKAFLLNRKDEATQWNLGIACTALKKWREARIAWKTFGIDVEINDQELIMNLGITPVRLENGEVVWTRRICPARAIIKNIPTLESGRYYNDLILNDGVPEGARIYNGEEYPVFNELDILQESDYHTYTLGVSTGYEKAIEQLKIQCEQLDYGFENWTHSIRALCEQCSKGIPHEHHDQALAKTQSTNEYQLAIAIHSIRAFRELVNDWQQKFEVSVNWKD